MAELPQSHLSLLNRVVPGVQTLGLGIREEIRKRFGLQVTDGITDRVQLPIREQVAQIENQVDNKIDFLAHCYSRSRGVRRG